MARRNLTEKISSNFDHYSVKFWGLFLFDAALSKELRTKSKDCEVYVLGFSFMDVTCVVLKGDNLCKEVVK